MSAQPAPDREQKLYEYAVVLFKEGGNVANVRARLMEYGVDQQTADQIIVRAKNRPPELVVKNKLSRDLEAQERRKAGRNFVLASIGIGALSGIFRSIPGASTTSDGAIIDLIFGLISVLLFVFGVYRWITSANSADEK